MDEARVRKFKTGATRNVAKGRPQYGGYYSPLSFRRYGEYMAKHQVQSDGTIRASDNWKHGISRRAFRESLERHWVELWTITDEMWGITPVKTSTEDIQETLCAIIFNAQGLLHEILIDRDTPKEE